MRKKRTGPFGLKASIPCSASMRGKEKKKERRAGGKGSELQENELSGQMTETRLYSCIDGRRGGGGG